MDARSRLARAVANPVLFARLANRLYHRRLGPRRHGGVDPFAGGEDWDNLLILDACRYDTFARRADLPGRLERRRSVASSTVEFLRATVDGRDLRDAVYVTANPQLFEHRESVDARFHAVVDVWREDGWDDDHGTVLPETVTAYAERAAERYPHKRLVVHYVQPHYPFVGSGTTFDEGHLDGGEGENVWNRLLFGSLDVAPAEVRRLYERNLDRALPHVETLLESLGGRTVVTADHGNMLGERASPVPVREWGHPRGIYTDELVAVPWLTHERGPRREVRADDPADGEGDEGERGTPATADGVPTDGAPADDVTDRLRDLGYAE